MDGGVFVTVEGVVKKVKLKEPSKTQLAHAKKEGYEAKTKTLVLVQWMGGQIFLNGKPELFDEVEEGSMYSFRCEAESGEVTRKNANGGEYTVTYHQAKFVIEALEIVDEEDAYSSKRAA